MKLQDKPNIYDNPEAVNFDRVIFKGRGGKTNNIKGNDDYRYFIQQLKPDYKGIEKTAKSNFSRVVKDTLLENGYNLVEKDGTFIDESSLDKEFRGKISQALREKNDFRMKPNNKELADEMVRQVRGKLKLSEQDVLDDKSVEDSGNKRKSAELVSDPEETTWVNKVVKRTVKKEPRDSFINGVSKVEPIQSYLKDYVQEAAQEEKKAESQEIDYKDDFADVLNRTETPVNYTEEDFNKDIKDVNLENLEGAGDSKQELAVDNNWRSRLQTDGEQVVEDNSFIR